MLKFYTYCDIITEYGDGAICDICYLHPRFSNFYEDFTETGLGLCCEEAVRIILTEKEKFNIKIPGWAENKIFLRNVRKYLTFCRTEMLLFLKYLKDLQKNASILYGCILLK